MNITILYTFFFFFLNKVIVKKNKHLTGMNSQNKKASYCDHSAYPRDIQFAENWIF